MKWLSGDISNGQNKYIFTFLFSEVARLYFAVFQNYLSFLLDSLGLGEL